MADIARGLGLDVNRDDFIALTRRFFEERLPHAGVLIVPGTMPRHRPERLAHAPRRWNSGRPGQALGDQPYLCTFLEA